MRLATCDSDRRVDAVDARWQTDTLCTWTQTPAADVCKIGFSGEETVAGRATCWTVLTASNSEVDSDVDVGKG